MADKIIFGDTGKILFCDDVISLDVDACCYNCPTVNCGSGEQRFDNVTYVVTLPDEILFWGSNSGNAWKYVTTGWSAFSGTWVYTYDHDLCKFNYLSNPVTINYQVTSYTTSGFCTTGSGFAGPSGSWTTNIVEPEDGGNDPTTHRFIVGNEDPLLSNGGAAGLPVLVRFLPTATVDQCSQSTIEAQHSGKTGCTSQWPFSTASGTADTNLQAA